MGLALYSQHEILITHSSDIINCGCLVLCNKQRGLPGRSMTVIHADLCDSVSSGECVTYYTWHWCDGLPRPQVIISLEEKHTQRYTHQHRHWHTHTHTKPQPHLQSLCHKNTGALTVLWLKHWQPHKEEALTKVAIILVILHSWFVYFCFVCASLKAILCFMLDTDTEEALSPYSVFILSVILHISWKLADKDQRRFWRRGYQFDETF